MNIYISNLHFNATDSDLKTLFSEYGEVTSAKVITDRLTGRSRGFGFVEMFDTESSKNAIRELNETEFQGKVINVNEAKPKEDKPRGNFGGGNSFNRDNGRGFKSNNNGGGSGGGNNRNKRW
jgi:RNA recognition motif-containing protein